jgi:hypothetical protein
MKLNFTLIFLTAFIFGINASAQTLSLDIKKADGSDQSVPLSSIQKINFSGSGLILNYITGNTETVGLSTIKLLTFTSFTALNNPDMNTNLEAYPNPTSDYVFLKNTDSNITKVAIYSVRGCKIADLPVLNNRIDISNLSRGIYLLKTNNRVLKISKQ